MGKNLSKEKRERVMEYLRAFKKELPVSEIERILQINEIEDYIDNETYGIVFEKHSEDVFERLALETPVFKNDLSRQIDTGNEGMNFILEGDNLHSLYLLAKTHKHNIDMIYIDPPYNTGAKDWKYNNNYVDKQDGYRHSKWLSMMNERLRIAKNLLKKDGVLVCAIDENELATISLLLEDIFGLDYHIDTICVVHNPRGVQGDNFSYTNEYALFVYYKGSNPIEPREIEESEIDWRDLRDNGHESLRTDAATCFYSINIKDNQIIGFGPNMTKDDSFHPTRNVLNEDGSISIYPIDIQGIERKWRYNRESVEKIVSKLRIKCVKGVYDIELGKNTGTYRTVWTSKKFDSNEYGTKLINDMVPTNDFDFPKSLYNVYECLNAVVRSKPNATVLDFFAGSGTTGHAVLLMNKLLGGNRHFILCTNNDIGEKKEKEFAKEYPHLVNADKTLNVESVEYKEWEERYGIARSITFPRIKAAIQGYNSSAGSKTLLAEFKVSLKSISDPSRNAKLLKEIKNVEEKEKNHFDRIETKFEEEFIRVYGCDDKNSRVDGLGGNVSYFKTEFVPITSEEDSLSESLMHHIKEMVALFEMDDIDDERIIVDDDQLLDLLADIQKYKGMNIYICPDVLISEDDRQIMSNNDVNIYEIPQLFFDKELRKAGEL